MNPQRRQLIIIGVIGAALLLVVFIIIAIVSSRPKSPDVNTAKVVIQVTPTDAEIKLNGKKVRSGEHIVPAPSKVTVEVSRKGFFKQSRSAQLSSLETRYFGLILESNSTETSNFYNDSTKQAKAANEIASQVYDQNSADVAYYNPLTRQLPYLGDGLDFRVDYAQHLGRASGPADAIYFQISANTEADRQKAINWIKDQGFDPSIMEIEFSDFSNPLVTGGAQ